MADWFIDSWSLLDGIAFASMREPWDDDHRLASPQTTVMIAPPDWRAVSISRPSTGIAASRRGFQEGFFDASGEVRFPSLDIVRAVVRRVYIAAGVGLDDAGEAKSTEPPGGELPRDDGTWLDIRERLLQVPRRDAGRQARAMFVDLVGTKAPAVWRSVDDFLKGAADATEGAWAQASGPDAFRSRQDLVSLKRLRVDLGLVVPHPFPYWYDLRVAPEVRERLRLLMRLPLRKRFPHYPELRTLAEQVFVVSASRTCFASLDTIRDLVPLLAAGVIAMGSAGIPPAGDEAYDNERWILGRAAEWVADLVPARLVDRDGAELADLEALVEETIRRIVEWRSTGGTSTTTPPSERGGPGGGPSQTMPGEAGERERDHVVEQLVEWESPRTSNAQSRSARGSV